MWWETGGSQEEWGAANNFTADTKGLQLRSPALVTRHVILEPSFRGACYAGSNLERRCPMVATSDPRAY